MNFLNTTLTKSRRAVCNFPCWRMIRSYKRPGGFDFKIEFDWWPNNTAPFNTAKPASTGTITLLAGKDFIMASCMIGDSENPPTIRRVDTSERLSSAISCCRCSTSMLIGSRNNSLNRSSFILSLLPSKVILLA